MDGLAVAELKGIVAPLNFTQPMAEKPYSYNYEPPPGVPVRNTREETHQVKILDGRAANDRLSLDREGFVLLRHPTAAKDLYNEAEIARVYYPECERLIQQGPAPRGSRCSIILSATPPDGEREPDQAAGRPRP